MTELTQPDAPVANRLLAALAAGDALWSHVAPDELTAGQVLYRPGEPIGAVYFPRTAAISVLTALRDGTMVESTMVGREGMIGLPVFLGEEHSRALVVCQIAGTAWRAPAEAFRKEVGAAHPLHRPLLRYASARLTQVAQNAACNRRHTLITRTATWLLLAGDAVGADEFAITQQFLALVLGVRRATVATAAGALQRKGLIRYRLGRVTIVDHPGLEATACECYAVIRAEFDRLLD